jgi:hypothetical protein
LIEKFADECRLAVWSLFKLYFPQHARRESGPIYRNFRSEERGWLTIIQEPKFLTHEQRYRRYLDLVKVQWAIADRALSSLGEAKIDTKPLDDR